MKTGGLTIRVQKIPLQTSPMSFRPTSPIMEARKKRSDRNEEVDQHLGCICNSGSPVLARTMKEKGVWVGYCRKCKPSPSTPSNYDYGFDASFYGEVR